MNERVWNIGRVKLLESELMDYFFKQGKKFLVNFRTVYQIFYNENSGFSYHKVYYKNNESYGITRRGRFVITDAKTVNHWLGFDLLVD